MTTAGSSVGLLSNTLQKRKQMAAEGELTLLFSIHDPFTVGTFGRIQQGLVVVVFHVTRCHRKLLCACGERGQHGDFLHFPAFSHL